MSTEGWKALKEKVGANYKNRFVWIPSYIDALVTRDRDTDANFHVTAITNTSGTVQERMTRNPFGAVAFRDSTGSTISVSSKAWDILHQGGQQDLIGNYGFHHRILSPTLDRWLTNDPLGFDAGDNNFYRSINNNPVITVDRFVLMPTIGDGENEKPGNPRNPMQPPVQQRVIDLQVAKDDKSFTNKALNDYKIDKFQKYTGW